MNEFTVNIPIKDTEALKEHMEDWVANHSDWDCIKRDGIEANYESGEIVDGQVHIPLDYLVTEKPTGIEAMRAFMDLLDLEAPKDVAELYAYTYKCIALIEVCLMEDKPEYLKGTFDISVPTSTSKSVRVWYTVVKE